MVYRTPVIIVALIIVGAVWYVQYVFYRTPVSIEQEGSDFAHEVQVAQPNKDDIPAIDSPVYESVQEADVYLDDKGSGLMVEVQGRYRFYPYQILVWHQIVNETFFGKELVVTYCPLCQLGLVYERGVNTEVLDFGTSGNVWNNNLVMYDRATESLWSQMLGEAVSGAYTGITLEEYPAHVVSWNTFKTEHPDGSVLSRDTGFDRDYTRDPYESEDYYSSLDIWFALSHHDDRLHSKEKIVGYDNDFGEVAYRISDVKDQGVMNDLVGNEPIVLFWDSELQTVRAFSRLVDDKILSFAKTEGFLQDAETGSLWNMDGEAINGSYRGIALKPLFLHESFWFCWTAFYPQTTLFQSES